MCNFCRVALDLRSACRLVEYHKIFNIHQYTGSIFSLLVAFLLHCHQTLPSHSVRITWQGTWLGEQPLPLICGDNLTFFHNVYWDLYRFVMFLHEVSVKFVLWVREVNLSELWLCFDPATGSFCAEKHKRITNKEFSPGPHPPIPYIPISYSILPRYHLSETYFNIGETKGGTVWFPQPPNLDDVFSCSCLPGTGWRLGFL